MLGLFFVAITMGSCSVLQDHENRKNVVTNTYTVAAIRPHGQNETFMTVMFLRSARFYKLADDADPAYIAMLKESEQHHTPVVITRASEESDVILKVSKPAGDK